MDSGNSSGSMQSSSGGEEEYDSRAESSSISALLNNQPQGHVGPFTTTSSSSSSHHLNPLTHHHHTPMFDPLSTYMDPTPPTLPNPIPSSSSSLPSLDMVWSKPRSDPNQPDNIRPLMQHLGDQTRGLGGVAAFPTTQQQQQEQQHSLPPQGANLLDQQAHNKNNNSNMVRNPKKRSRASRRAPTTVLTTDTTNFRAMVQEFTGIPAPPFPSSPFPRTRLDLFGNSVASSSSSSSSSTAIRSHLEAPPYQLLRPFAQKVQPNFPQSTSSSSSFPLFSSVDTLLLPNNNNNNNSTNSCANSTAINYQQLSSSLDHHLGLLKQQVNVNTMHNIINNNNNNNNNPIFSFQSILQAPQQPRYTLGNNNSSPLHHLASSKNQPSLEIPQTSTINSTGLKVGVLEELGLMSHAHVNSNQVVGGLHHHHHHHQNNMVHSSSDGALSTVNNNDGDHHGGGVFLRSLSGTAGGNYSDDIIHQEQRVSNGKVNYTVASSSPSDFHGEKGPDCGVATAARSEGMVESWINCSSD